MNLTLQFAAILGLLFLPFVSADKTQFRIFHRLYHPTESQGGFQERGLLSIAQDNTVSFEFASTFPQDLSSFAADLQSVKEKDILLYQIALEREGDATEAQWDVSSVKACHLAGSTSEHIYLHVTDIHSPRPYAINYFVSPIPHNGACPNSRPKSTDTFESFVQVNTTVILKGPNVPPLPQLVSPPPITAEGEPVTPLPEKTFLEKNWLYIVGGLLALLLAAGGEEEKPKKR